LDLDAQARELEWRRVLVFVEEAEELLVARSLLTRAA
jgi:hypothetical protein